MKQPLTFEEWYAQSKNCEYDGYHTQEDMRSAYHAGAFHFMLWIKMKSPDIYHEFYQKFSEFAACYEKVRTDDDDIKEAHSRDILLTYNLGRYVLSFYYE